MARITDEEYRKLYCLWAQDKYGLSDVESVSFDLGRRGPYSQWTPDVDVFVEVAVKIKDRQSLLLFEVDNPFDLINSINDFLMTHVAVGVRRAAIVGQRPRRRVGR
jgi:hypothetical protein